MWSSEDARVLHAVDAMESGDLARLGGLLNASHESLRDDYAVSCRELDTWWNWRAGNPASTARA